MTKRRLPIKPESRVCLGEVVMAANLYRPIASVCDLNNDGSSVLVQNDVAGHGKNFAWYHFIHASANWVMNTHQFGAVWKSCFHLHLGNHLRDAFHHLLAAQNLATFRHELSNRLAIARRLQDEIGYERNALGIVELDPSF